MFDLALVILFVRFWAPAILPSRIPARWILIQPLHGSTWALLFRLLYARQRRSMIPTGAAGYVAGRGRLRRVNLVWRRIRAGAGSVQAVEDEDGAGRGHVCCTCSEQFRVAGVDAVRLGVHVRVRRTAYEARAGLLGHIRHGKMARLCVERARCRSERVLALTSAHAARNSSEIPGFVRL